MADYVLVHGGNMSTETWNRMTNRNRYPPGGHLGARYWDGTKTYLESHGHRVFAPALEDEHTHTLKDHVGQVCRIIEENDLHGVILVGHSYGGMVVTGVADRLRKRIRHLVYLDAALPDPGDSLFDLFLEAHIDPFSFPGLKAATAYVQKLSFDPRKIRQLNRTYILCTGSEFAPVTRLAKAKIDARPEGWSYRELPTSHVPMATLPGQFCRLMLEFANR